MGLPSLSRSLSPGRPSGEARAGALPSGLQLPEPPQERGAAALPAPPPRTLGQRRAGTGTSCDPRWQPSARQGGCSAFVPTASELLASACSGVTQVISA